jgi:hypothetical protein
LQKSQQVVKIDLKYCKAVDHMKIPVQVFKILSLEEISACTGFKERIVRIIF